MRVTSWYRALSWPLTGTTLPVALFVFPIIVLWMPPTGVWGDNEQHYLWLARQWVGFDGVPANSALLGGMPHAYAFLSIAGSVLGVFGEEGGQAALRLLTAAFWAYASARFALALGLRAVEAGILILLFVLSGQELFAGEWLIGGVEPKALAYPCILLAWSQLLGRRYMYCVLWLVAASHFHLIVGGLWAMFVILAALIDERRIRPLSLPVLAYGLLVLPLVLFIQQLYEYNEALVGGSVPSAAHILAVVRNPHHSAPWSDLQTLAQWMPGIAALVGIFWSATNLVTITTGRASQMLARLITISSSFLLLAIIASYWDKTGVFVSLTPFRVGSLTLLLTLALLLSTAREIVTERRAIILIPTFIVLGSVYAVSAAVDRTGSPIVYDRRHTREFRDLWQYARSETPSSSVFLADPALERATWDFERRAARSMLVVWKFIPSRSPDVQEWYRRERFRALLFRDGCPPNPAYHVDYLIVLPEDVEKFSPCGSLAYGGHAVALVKLRPGRE